MANQSQNDQAQAPADHLIDRTGKDRKRNEPSDGMTAGESRPQVAKDGGDAETEQPPPPGEVYPPQLHAGKVGLGPMYHQGPDLADRIGGFQEELRGKITHNAERVQHGHDRMTGELKRKEQEEYDASNPFETTEETKGKEKAE